MSWAIVTTVATVVIAASAAAGVSYTVYSATNPPKTPKQATDALNSNSKQLTKLQAKQAELATKPTSPHNDKQKADVAKAIGKVQDSITFLTNWISTNGDTTKPTTAEKNFVALTDKSKLVANNTPSTGGAVISTTPNNNYGLIGIISGGVLLIIFIGLIAYKKFKH